MVYLRGGGGAFLQRKSASVIITFQFYVHINVNENGDKNEYLPNTKDGYNYITKHNHRYANIYLISYVSGVLLGFL